MISKLEFQDYRCFNSLILEDIRRVTLVSGSNSVGKSSLLEGIFLFIDRFSQDVFLKLNGFRGYHQVSMTPAMLWEHLFYNGSKDKPLEISLTRNGLRETVKIIKDIQASVSIPMDQNIYASSQLIMQSAAINYPLRINYLSAALNLSASYIIASDGVRLHSTDDIKCDRQFVQYISPRISMTSATLTDWFSRIKLEGKADQFMSVLRRFDLRICDLSVISLNGINYLYTDFGNGHMHPLNLLGDGINRFMAVMIAMIANPGSVLLIDEIDTGIHYSFFSDLWENIGLVAEETGCQIFATTHSFECIKGMLSVNNGGNEDIFRFVRLDNVEGTIIPKIYSREALEFAVINNWEVR